MRRAAKAFGGTRRLRSAAAAGAAWRTSRGAPPRARRLLPMAGMFHTGDFVYPTDLPRRFLCRVTEEESFRVESGTAQILKLAPLEGPWPEGTLLVRPDVWVRPAGPAARARGARSAA